ncbi:MAG: 50S ribosomal protein L17 [Candidatus Nealsonbacteria bacterium RIFCSPHIGHO2_01_FULL_43_31]|uniref:50S ribosomal protein L17 n=2 Tax=Candidatus Nealsoniibacteriota TaxID=1817911 RepID=A0A1G2E8L0_9BACT|nr:MAG: 50S ribosomal protein L17 [Candidatus Nealsonbacteria bacterium RIFCSPHIGHO2_01_FULL_43_31]OGZ22203.1 MAG: 50S ribosomal protein L17 [Candidatus Nealsonbacteria bacterium RIFCSPHIGHO2_02_FULL_43_13]OGZ25102.1 MAG: 50S ribosomal protein L17 [Candidatus Nealsonbacteria bacterium RIFCSPLOWO2_01_FULL_43_36]
MRKRQSGRKFNRESGQRRALLKGLATALILKERIQTTEAKAKEASSYVEKFITIAKKGDLNSKRRLLQFFAPKVVKKLTQEIVTRYQARKGGYTRVIKLGQRFSDGSRMALIEFIK